MSLHYSRRYRRPANVVTDWTGKRHEHPGAEPTEVIEDETHDAPDLLAEVADVLAERQATYGDSSSHHVRTAQVWSAVFGWDVSARQVCLAIALDKFVRAEQSPRKRDHYADIVGYSKLAWDRAREE